MCLFCLVLCCTPYTSCTVRLNILRKYHMSVIYICSYCSIQVLISLLVLVLSWLLFPHFHIQIHTIITKQYLFCKKKEKRIEVDKSYTYFIYSCTILNHLKTIYLGWRIDKHYILKETWGKWWERVVISNACRGWWPHQAEILTIL